MSDKHTVWIDVKRCTGCAACVETCPVGAITLTDNKARVDEEVCTGCEACIEVCPEDAIQLVVQGELVLAPARPAPTVHEPSPVAQTVGAAAAATGVGLLMKLAEALAQTVGRWLTRPSTRTGTPAGKDSSSKGPSGAGRGRKARHRRRGQ